MEISPPPRWLTLTIAAALLVAILPLPYGYYQVLRIVVTGYASYLCYLHYRRELQYWPWILAFIAVLYNPFYPIFMSKGFHSLLNIAVSALMVFEQNTFRPVKRSHEREPSGNNDAFRESRARPPLKSTDRKGLVPAILLTATLAVICGAGVIAFNNSNSPRSADYDAVDATAEAAAAAAAAVEMDVAADATLSMSAIDPATGISEPMPSEEPAGAASLLPAGTETESSDSFTSNPYGTASLGTTWRGKIGRCKLNVGSLQPIDGACWIRLDGDGSFQIMSMDEQIFAQLDRDGAAGVAFWNETPGASHAHASLGSMTRDGACWHNASAELCAWAI